MPDATLLDEVSKRATVVTPLDPRLSATRCDLSAQICECVRASSTDTSFESLAPGSATGIKTRVGPWTVFAASWDSSQMVFERLLIVRGSHAFRAEKARRVDGSWRLEDITMGDAANGDDDRCGTSTRTVAANTAAESLELSPTPRLHDVSVGWIPVGDASPSERSSGLLPPALRADGTNSELEASGYIAPLGSLVATVAPRRWYGGGVRLHGDAESLDLQAIWTEQDGTQPLVWGRYGIGSPRQRIDLQLEHPAHGPAARLRQLENDAFLRGFRRSIIGANLSGPTYGFRIDGSWLSGNSMADSADLSADFGGRASVAQHLQLDFEVDHRSVVVDDDSTHSSSAAARIGLPFGSRSTVWFNPALTLYNNYGVIPAEQGFEASASGGVMASVDASVSWAGRFDESVHLVSPRIQLGRELLGIAQRAPLPADAPEYLFTRVPNFNWVALSVENVWVGRNWRVEAPVGAVAVGDLDAVSRPRPFAQLTAQRDWFESNASVICDEECVDIGWLSSASVSGVGGWARLQVGEVSVSDVRALSFARQLDSPGAPIRLTQPTVDERNLVARTQGELALGSLGLLAHTGASEAGWSGAYGGARYRWRPLGFGVSALAGWDHQRQDWSVMVGLSL